MRPQNRGSPSCWNFKTPTWESRDKNHLDVAPVERRRVYYKGEGGGFPPSPGRGESCVSKLPVARPSTKIVPTMH
jgi:hypothetical protein